MRGTGAAIRTEDLRVRRGPRRTGPVVIDGLHLTVPRGRVVGLLGPSGSGKTSLMRAVVGVQAGVSGTVEVLGLPAGHPDLRERVGYVTQSPSVYGDLTVSENLRYFARLRGLPDGAVARALADVDLVRLGDRRVGDLSGGERSRTSLAVALLGDPELLVLDEPTVGLDPVLRRDLWALFRGLAARGTSLLVSSHVMDEATRCDRLLLLRDGTLLADASLPELLASTGTEDAEQAFLALAEGAHPTGYRDAVGPHGVPGDGGRRARQRPGRRHRGRSPRRRGYAVSARPTFATAARVLAQLRHDPRTIGLVVAMPCVVIGLLAWMFHGTDVLDRFGPLLVALFPMVVMFLVTSVATLRERQSGTLERLLTTPVRRADVVVGYALAFGLVAAGQAVVVTAFAVWVCGMSVAGPLGLLMLVAVADAVLGAALGLGASAAARTEFQAVQLMPAVMFPQLLLAGLLMPRDQMPVVLEAVSRVLPMTYALEATAGVAAGGGWGEIAAEVGVVATFVALALAVGSLTLRRRTP